MLEMEVGVLSFRNGRRQRKWGIFWVFWEFLFLAGWVY